MAIFSITSAQKSVLTDQATNIGQALSVLAASFGWSQGSTLIPIIGSVAFGLFSLLSSIHVVNVSAPPPAPTVTPISQ